MATTTTTTTNGATPKTKSRLVVGEVLRLDEMLTSENGQYRLMLQTDSNCCLYASNDEAIWSTGTYRRGVVKAVVEANGNFALYRDWGSYPSWSSDTEGRGNATSTLVVQDDGNLVLTSDGKTIWSSNTGRAPRKPRAKPDRLEAGESLERDESLNSPNGLYRLTLQRDGNFVLYREKKVLWSSETERSYDSFPKVMMQSDGDLRLADDRDWNRWSSRSGRSDAKDPVLILQDDGNIVINSNNSVIWSANTRQSPPRAKQDRLEVGQFLRKDESLTSPNGKYKLTIQGDGNFVLYDGDQPLWATSTRGYGEPKVELQQDSNLVLSIDDRAEWSTNTGGRGSAKTVLLLENDANLTLSADGKQLWSANSRQIQAKPRVNLDRLEVGQVLRKDDSLVSPNKTYKLVMQGDGNFVLYKGNDAIWGAQSNGSERAVLQDDGNLVVTKMNNEVKWSSGSGGRGNATSVLIMQDDGDAVILSSGKKIWATGTKARLPDRLEAGQDMGINNDLVSPNQRYRLRYTSDATLILLDDWTSIWSTPQQVGYKPSSITMRDDDNLVVGNDGMVWSSDTRRRGGGGNAVLQVRDSGDAIIRSDGLIIWSTNPSLVQPWGPVDIIPVPAGSTQIKAGQYLPVGQSITSSNKQWTMTLQNDGNFVVRRVATNKIIWSSNTPNSGVTSLMMTWKNNLTLYGPDKKELWTSKTPSINKLDTLILNDDGNLSTTDSWRLWQTDTRFPATAATTDHLDRGERLAVDQALVSGDAKLTFSSLGIFCVTKSGSSTYYYPEQPLSYVSQIVFNRDAALELKDDSNKVLATYKRADNKEIGTSGSTQFVLGSDGKARMVHYGTDVWLLEDLASGSSPNTPSSFNNTLQQGARLYKGGTLWSSNKRYKLILQDDGNLVLYDTRTGYPIWSTSTNGRGDFVEMQSDANLVVYQSNGSSPWSSGTNRKSFWGERSTLVVQNDGTLNIKVGDNVVWVGKKW